jgi:hypothetical protein
MAVMTAAILGFLLVLIYLLRRRMRPNGLEQNAMRFRRASDNAMIPTRPWE